MTINTGTRPTIMGTRGLASTGHYLSALAAVQILARGGNAIDAGVAAGLCQNVVLPDMCNLVGVADIMIYDSSRKQVYTYRGAGWWPKAITPDHFYRYCGGKRNVDAVSSIVPGAADAWLHALKEHGTMTFTEVSAAALEYAEFGFPVHQSMLHSLTHVREDFDYPGLRELYYPNDGQPPNEGDIFVQRDLASTLRRMSRAERNAGGDREKGIQAVRDYVYRGPIAEQMVAYAKSHGSLLCTDDFADFEADQWPPVKTDFGPYTVYGCGPWCQGPVVPIALNVLKHFDLASMGHNTPQYIHTVVGALDLAFSDRHFFFGDTDYIGVPMEGLLSNDYANERSKLIRESQPFAELPPQGNPWKYQDPKTVWPNVPVEARQVYENIPVPPPNSGKKQQALDDDTTFAGCADSAGNFFSATFSGGHRYNPGAVPGLGLSLSHKGIQNTPLLGHPNSMAPRKRPRLTVNPGMIFKNGEPWAVYGSPAGDRQPQAMIQVFLNIAVFGMEPQEAIQAPRFFTFNHPKTSPPHDYWPKRISAENRIGEEVFRTLRDWGYRVDPWPPFELESGAPCIVIREPSKGGYVFKGGADPRRQSYAIAF